MNSNTSSTNNYTLGSPNLGTKRPLSGASFKWAPSEDIQPFTVYEEYLKSVTKGGEAADHSETITQKLVNFDKGTFMS